MKYCPKCKSVHLKKELTLCPQCRRKLIENPSPHSPVKVVTANGFELERIKASLTEADIPFSVTEERYDTGLQILNDAPPENCSFFIPLSHYDKALETLIGIGAADPDTLQALDQQDEAFLQQSREQEKQDELPENKARWIRIGSLLGFLLFLGLFAYLVDRLLALVTPLLGW